MRHDKVADRLTGHTGCTKSLLDGNFFRTCTKRSSVCPRCRSSTLQQVACLGMKLLFPHTQRLKTHQGRLCSGCAKLNSEHLTHAYSSAFKSEIRLQVHVDNCPQGIIKAVMLPLSNHCIGSQSLNPGHCVTKAVTVQNF